MSTRSLIILSMVLPATVAIVACSSAPPPAPAPSDKSTDNGNDNTASNSQDVTSTPSATVTAPPKPLVIDAGIADSGVDAAKTPTPVQGAPQPTTHFCTQLSQCCGNLSTFQALACTGTAIAGDETACGVELAVCNAGGIDFGGLFGDDDDTTNP
jgi:PBP1b-binding outer membrane lipoprotein LpoB